MQAQEAKLQEKAEEEESKSTASDLTTVANGGGEGEAGEEEVNQETPHNGSPSPAEVHNIKGTVKGCGIQPYLIRIYQS